MSLVTITDHNTVEGCLRIEHLPGTFLSEEVTTYFPQDGCKVHVLVYDITEEQHREISGLRRSIYDLAAYLHERGVHHAVAHPLAPVNSRLRPEHVEQLLLLFKGFEINGDNGAAVNDAMRRILAGLTLEGIERLADRHNLRPLWEPPARKCLVGGSDDHGSLYVATTYTRAEAAYSGVGDFMAAVFSGRGEVVGGASHPTRLAHSIYGITYQFYRDRFKLGSRVNKDLLLRFADRCLRSDPEAVADSLLDRLIRGWTAHRRDAESEGDSPLDLIRREATRLIRSDGELLRIVQNPPETAADTERAWRRFVSRVSNRLLLGFSQDLIERFRGASVLGIFHSLGSAGALSAMLSPYFVSYSMHSCERQFAQRAERGLVRLLAEGPPAETRPEPRVAHFTDTLYEVNGVAKTLQGELQVARKYGWQHLVLTCQVGKVPEVEGALAFEPLAAYELPPYPQQKLCIPPFLDMLAACYDRECNLVHLATPGPVGLAGLAAARILKLPVLATHHTDLPCYARYLTDDSGMEDMVWKFQLWFYNQMDLVLVCSQDSAEDLASRGLAREKMRVMPRGVDVRRFCPSRRSRKIRASWGPEKVMALYVGRVSREKDLDLLAEAFREFSTGLRGIRLVVVGDGPYLAEMRRAMRDLPCTFTGCLDGDRLAASFASADFLVFPSTTDTFGNVVLEAQSSGLPVIVSDAGGPRENVLPGRTGLVTAARSRTQLVAAMRVLAQDSTLRRRMGLAAREFLEGRSFERACRLLWGLMAEVISDRDSAEDRPERPPGTAERPAAPMEVAAT
jgi:glycosyltransferase involved in cell wall biosynthesis